ncbi:MAG: 3-keto-disaccharide hydrolase [Planctomycetota bacterium]
MVRQVVMAAMVAAVAMAAAQAGGLNEPPEGFTALFNGKDLDGWYGMRHMAPRKLLAMTDEQFAALRQKSLSDVRKHWRVEDGELVNDGHGAYLTTNRFFGDIELLIDYKTVPKADSGIYLRATPQVQIWDTTKAGGKWGIGADKGSGGLWNVSKGNPGKDPLVHADKPFGEWNHFRIVQVGARTSIWLNGKQVVDYAVMENYFNRKLPLAPRGPIQLQTHGGEIRWRNIFVREIPPEEANAWLREHDADGFQPIFNGKDLDGWQGAVNNYEVTDGAIACKKGKGGALFTKGQFGDFIVRLDIRVPPGGNNGLAIRYPGRGNPAYAGMCELQVLDNTAKKWAKLDPRQYHASAYGMVPAHRGYMRPPGQWNYQKVTVKDSTIEVELNGTIILDCDLAKVKEHMGNRPHPGKDRKRGHFGFAGHGDPVAFRHIEIKRLD